MDLCGPDSGGRGHPDGGGRNRFAQVGKHGVKSDACAILCNVLIYEAKKISEAWVNGTYNQAWAKGGVVNERVVIRIG